MYSFLLSLFGSATALPVEIQVRNILQECVEFEKLKEVKEGTVTELHHHHSHPSENPHKLKAQLLPYMPQRYAG